MDKHAPDTCDRTIVCCLADGHRDRCRSSHEAASLPDDIRALGWSVAVHNDYRLNGEAHTFWLFTKDGRAVKGEGRTDAEALIQVRRELATTFERRR